jgi:hypothetical protein
LSRYSLYPKFSILVVNPDTVAWTAAIAAVTHFLSA